MTGLSAGMGGGQDRRLHRTTRTQKQLGGVVVSNTLVNDAGARGGGGGVRRRTLRNVRCGPEHQ